MMRVLVVATVLAVGALSVIGAAGAAQASVIEFHLEQRIQANSALIGPVTLRDVIANVRSSAMPVPAATRISQLPEPEVLAMMLVGLCLIGYRVGRISSEKFK